MDKFSYKNTPLGKAFTKAQSTPPPPPVPAPPPVDTSEIGAFSLADDRDVITRRYPSSFIANNIGGKAYLQYDKVTNKIRFQVEVPNREGKKEVADTGWFKPILRAGDDTTESDKIAATLGRALTKAGRGKKLTVEEKEEYQQAINHMANDLTEFSKYVLESSKPKPNPEA